MNRADLSIPPTPPIRSAQVRTTKTETIDTNPAGGIGPENAAEPAMGGVLVLGKGISLKGSIVGADRIVIEGLFESSRLETSELIIGRTGTFRGEAVVSHAEIDGRFEGLVRASGRLGLLSGGSLVGSAQYGRLSVQDGASISGDLASLKE